MRRVTVKGLLNHKLRLLTTSVAVLLGVAFMTGAFVLTDTVGKNFDELFREVSANTDAVVRSAEEIETPFGGAMRARIDDSLLETVLGVEGVSEAEPTVTGYAQFVDPDGEPIGRLGGPARTIGQAWQSSTTQNPFRVVDGRPPEADREVVMDAGTAELGRFSVGDEVTVLSRLGPETFTLTGIAMFGTVDSPAGANVALFTLATAQRILHGEPGKLDTIAIAGDSGISQTELAARIDRALPAGLEVVTGEEFTEENQSLVRQRLSFFNTFLLVFAAVSLFVGAFIIYNTFTILVAQRTREMALLRAVGASRRQVMTSVLAEALVVGTIAGTVGLGAGVVVAAGLKALIGALGFNPPASGLVVLMRTFVASLVVGVGVTVVSAFFPARKAARVPPLAALRDVAVDRSGSSRARVAAGLAVFALGAILLFGGLAGGPNALARVGLGMAEVFLAVAILGPIIAAPVASTLGSLLAATGRATAALPRSIRGASGGAFPAQLARQNALRNPRRTASTAAALMIGVGLVSFIAIFAESAKASIAATIDEAFIGDFVIDSGAFLRGGLNPELAEEIEALPEVERAAGIRAGLAEVAGEAELLIGIDPEDGLALFDIGIVAGDPLALDEDGIAVLDSFAAEVGWSVGSTVPVNFLDTGEQELTVGLIYTEAQIAGRVFLGLEAFEANFANQADTQIMVSLAPGVSAAEARPAIEELVEPYATAKLQDLTEFKEAQAAQINTLLSLVYAMLGLAIIIALVGIANTLALSVFERTRELGLLRAVGMTRAQLRSAVRFEAANIALFGTALGLVIGIFFGWAIVEALRDEGFSQLRIPAGQIALIVVIAVISGVVAAILPARRAARLDVLAAIATE